MKAILIKVCIDLDMLIDNALQNVIRVSDQSLSRGLQRSISEKVILSQIEVRTVVAIGKNREEMTESLNKGSKREACVLSCGPSMSWMVILMPEAAPRIQPFN